MTDQDTRDLRAELAARRVLAQGRRVRAPERRRLSVGPALAGAAVSVVGVCLGIGTLLWVTDDPSQGRGPVVSAPVSSSGEVIGDDPVGAEPATPAVVDPPAVAPPSSVAPAPPASVSPLAQEPSVVVPVTVLNNSRITGLADRAATRFRAGGWPVTLTGNFRGQIPVTTVYYDPGMQASAQAFADAFEGIVRVRPRLDTLPARGVVVVLTREFPS